MMKKIQEIDKKIAVIEERTKKIDSLPTKNEMQSLISKTLNFPKIRKSPVLKWIGLFLYIREYE
ncbi:hypothetical protein MOB44_18580 [Bacillus sonorensis]|uniref:hypothetical protein n=1 Tax=Bacillus sonorensis TaxID=119858 RepID=UPI0022814C19|nr:hypothetical protein [Bacillus sonorensis]MCY7858638.1 hypothetical protein [Bacillus sonorensis]